MILSTVSSIYKEINSIFAKKQETTHYYPIEFLQRKRSLTHASRPFETLRPRRIIGRPLGRRHVPSQSLRDCGVQVEESRVTIGQWVALADEPNYVGPEKRKSPRAATDDPAVLTVLKAEHSPRITMRIVDTSSGGLKLELPRELMTGIIVQVRVGELFILAEVRYCIPDARHFHAGVRIQNVFQLCPPEHRSARGTDTLAAPRDH